MSQTPTPRTCAARRVARRIGPQTRTRSTHANADGHSARSRTSETRPDKPRGAVQSPLVRPGGGLSTPAKPAIVGESPFWLAGRPRTPPLPATRRFASPMRRDDNTKSTAPTLDRPPAPAERPRRSGRDAEPRDANAHRAENRHAQPETQRRRSCQRLCNERLSSAARAAGQQQRLVRHFNSECHHCLSLDSDPAALGAAQAPAATQRHGRCHLGPAARQGRWQGCLGACFGTPPSQSVVLNSIRIGSPDTPVTGRAFPTAC
jgi:hypothetical protein